MRDYSKKLLQGTFVVLLFSVFSTVCGYLVKYLLSQTVEVKDIGLFFSVLGFVTFFTFFRDLGLSDALIFFIPRFLVEKAEKKIKSSICFTLFVQIGMGLCFFFVMLILAGFFADNYFKDPRANLLLVFLSFYFIIDGIHEVLLRSFHGYQEILFQQLLDLCFQFFSLLFMALVLFLKKDIILFGIAYILSDLVAVILFYFVFTKKVFPKFHKVKTIHNKKLKKQLLSYSIPMMTWTVAETGYAQQTVIFLTLFSGLESVGYYAMIKTIAKLAIFVYKASSRAFSPMISELWKKNKKRELNFLFREQIVVIYMIGLPIIFGIVFFSDILLRILYGEKFVAASLALKIAALYFLFDIMNSNLNSLLQCTGNPKIPRNNAYVKFFSNLVFNLMLIPFFGLIGAVLADLIAIFCALLYSLYQNTKKLRIVIPVKEVGLLLVSAGAYVFSILVLRRMLQNTTLNVYVELIVIGSISGCIYLSAVFLFKLIDLKKINAFIKKTTNNRIDFIKD